MKSSLRRWSLVAMLALLIWAGFLPAAPAQGAGPTLGGCPVFPADNIWNMPVNDLPVDSHSAAYVQSIGAGDGLKADFGAGLWNGGPIGIPFISVPQSQPLTPITFDPDGYPDQSDAGPFPIPLNAPVEGGAAATGDRHVLAVQQGTCKLYELYKSYPSGGNWRVYSSAVYDLQGYGLRPDEWTSADAAGLPIFPGLARYDEVASGAIRHALRFTAERTQRAYVWPARHFASDETDPALPPMGQRFRLKASFDISGFSAENQVILQALKTYGMILADNGSPWYVSGAPDERWNNDDLQGQLQNMVHGSDFEAVDVSSLQIDPNSAQARVPLVPLPPDKVVARVYLPLTRR